MNQPIDDRVKKLEERMDRIEQATEPIKVTDTVLLQTIMTMVGTQATDIGVLKHHMEGARADITSIKATVSDHSELLKDLKITQDAQGAKLDQILKLLQSRQE